MIRISTHAALRFAQRAMEVDVEELDDRQDCNIKCKILELLMPISSRIATLKSGTFIIDNMGYVIVDMVLVTVKPPSSEYTVMKGGARHSGRKIKKFTKLRQSSY